jgi:predicted metal-dependent hydrolase
MSLDWNHGALLEGLRCFHSGAFFEAHEHWESVWLMTEEPEKTFLQGLIQVAAAFHHFQRGNCAGTISLLRSALRRLDGMRQLLPASPSSRFARQSACG